MDIEKVKKNFFEQNFVSWFWSINLVPWNYQFSSVQSLSRVRLFVTPWIAARQASLSITNPRSSLRLASVESVMPPSHLILGHPLLLLPSIPPSIKTSQFSFDSFLGILRILVLVSPSAAVTNYHKFVDLKQHNFIILQFWPSEVSVHKTKVWIVFCSIRRL